jgi:hypothetical protein
MVEIKDTELPSPGSWVRLGGWLLLLVTFAFRLELVVIVSR